MVYIVYKSLGDSCEPPPLLLSKPCVLVTVEGTFYSGRASVPEFFI